MIEPGHFRVALFFGSAMMRSLLPIICCLLLGACTQFEKPYREQNPLFGATVGTAWDLMRGEDFGSTYAGTAGGKLPKTGSYSFAAEPGSRSEAAPHPEAKPAPQLDQEGREALSRGVAVVEFEAMGALEMPDAGRMVAEWMVNGLVKNSDFDLRERILLKKILDEQHLAISGLQSDRTQTSRIGELYGIGVIVTGGVSRWEQVYTVSARLIDASTGRILRSAERSTSLASNLPAAIDLLTKELAGS